MEQLQGLGDYHTTAIVGLRGAGKTALMACLGTSEMVPPFCEIAINKSKKRIAEDRAEGWTNTSFPEHVKHLVYCVDDVFTSNDRGYKPQNTHELAFERIGINSKYIPNEFEYLPPFSVILCPEIQVKLEARKSMTDGPSDNFLRFIELQRHHGIRMVYDTQRLENVDIKLRELTDRIIKIKKMTHEMYGHHKEFPRSTTWHCLEFYNYHSYKRYLETGDESEGRATTYYFSRGNIFSCYNTHSHKIDFIPSVGNYSPHEAKPIINKDEAIEYRERCPLIKPKKEKGNKAA